MKVVILAIRLMIGQSALTFLLMDSEGFSHLGDIQPSLPTAPSSSSPFIQKYRVSSLVRPADSADSPAVR